MIETGKIIRNILEERNLSQVWLANRIGVTPATLSRWITGENAPASIGAIVETAKVLNVSTDYLLGITPVPSATATKDYRPEEKILINCFRRASDDDTTVLWALMRKYMNQNESMFMEQFNSVTQDAG